MDLAQIILLGLIQAITEWLPLSSKTICSFVYLNFFGGSPEKLVSVLLFLHLGTLLSAIVYLRKELFGIFSETAKAMRPFPGILPKFLESKQGFIFFALLSTGAVGLPLLVLEKALFPTLSGELIHILMGSGLVLTGFLLTASSNSRWRTAELANWKDGLFVGALQGLSVLPGVSRAGSTTAGLIWRGFNPSSALLLSFLLSIPTVIFAELLFWSASQHFSTINFSDGFLLLISSFIFGYATIDALLQLAQRFNLAWLAFLFGIIMLVFGSLGMS
ncbi:MAG: undecaprenyl-diphosphate phosphatase [Candidatus Micrarchaeota archaeon]|nr:undecaprenyl-diphosphate phosphatase [Candidatus Micrarchaeota archaeon]